jgi:small-conductance mechanosensitive channel
MSLEATLVGVNDWIHSYLPEGTPDYISQGIVSLSIFIVFIVLGWIVYHIFQRYLTRWAERTKTKLDDEILKNIKKPIYFFVILLGTYYALINFDFIGINYSGEITFIFRIAEILLVTFIITRVVNVVIAWYAESQAAKKRMSEHILFVFKRIINAFIFIIAFLVILWVNEIDLTGIAVGLGVGGIAIAFALQNVLSDIFSAFSIYFDRPFEIGDFIIVGEYAGTVRKIGMKSTRVQLLQGEELVLSNRELTSISVRNFKKLKKRRIVFHFGITYDTPLEKLKKIPDMVKKIVNSQELSEIDRVHFTEFGDFSLNFEVVYYMKKGDYVLFRDTQQQINFAIKGAFEKEGIEMAYPTQTIFLNK